jgi:hypothetical protein
MKELLENLLEYFNNFQAASCNCHACKEARAWIILIKKELKRYEVPPKKN